MAVTTKQVTIPERIETRDAATICDLCGAESPEPDNWCDETYYLERVVIRHEAGYSYPECGQVTKFTIDLCPACFEEKLKPWFASQGVVGRSEETDW